MYDKPRPNIDQGDIFERLYFYSRDEERLAILVTPICDIVHDKADYLIFCGIFPFSELAEPLVKTSWPELEGIIDSSDTYDSLSRKNKENIEKKISLLLANYHFPRYHCLYPFPKSEELHLVDFQVVSSLHINEARDKNRLFSLNSPFREQIPVRYSTYMSRIGVPFMGEKRKKELIDITSKKLFEIIKAKIIKT